MKIINRKDIINCTLCYDAPCSKACKEIDVAKQLRSIWFKNTEIAATRTPGNISCATCNAPCERYCTERVSIKNIMMSLSQAKDKAPILTKQDYDRLKTDICGIPLENPFLLSSSVVSSDYDMCARAFDAGWAGVCYKTVSMMEFNEASPRYSATKDSTGSINAFKNIEQLSQNTVEENVDIFKRLKKDYPTKFLLVSIMGRDEKEWEYLASEVTKAGADAIELNFSCPNMVEDGTGSDVGQIPELIEKFTRAAKRGTTIPVLAKLTPNVGTMKEAAEAAIRGGADGLAAINTIKSIISPASYFEKQSIGGLSGNAVYPIALRFVSELSLNTNLAGVHISAMGGIEDWTNALDFILLGAKSVQVTTAVMQYGTRIIDDLIDGLALILKKFDTSVRDAAGFQKAQIVDVEDIDRDNIIYPKFITENCFGCGRCYISCNDGGHQAIKFENRKPTLDVHRCVGCHLCTLVCPHQAIVSSGIKVPKRK